MSSTGEPRTVFEFRGRPAPAWLVWAGLALAWFWTIQLHPFHEPDEGRYAEIPREMVASGDWLTPRLDGLKYFEKPPLQYWATAVLYKGFGVSEWTARAWCFALSFLCLLLTFVWVRRMYDVRAAAAALAVLAMSPLFLVVGHINVLDGAFTFWLTGMVFAFTLAQSAAQGSRSERNWMLLTWLAAALAVLSKGIVVPVLAGLTLTIYSLVQRDVSSWRRLHMLAGLAVFLAVAAPWFVAMSLRNPEFPKFFFLHEHFARFLTNVHRRTEPWWYFLPIAAVAVLPWLTCLRAAVVDAWREPSPANGFRPLRFLLIFAAVVPAFFSLSHSKLAPYILPMLPPLAAVIGVHAAKHPVLQRRAAWIAALAVTVCAAGLVIYLQHRYDAGLGQPLAWGIAAVGITMFAALTIKKNRSLPCNALAMAVASMLAWQCLMAAYGSPRSARDLVKAVAPQVSAATALYNIGQYRQSVPPYLGRTLVLVNYKGELEFGMEQEPGRNAATLDEFKQRWAGESDAIAFFEPRAWNRLRDEGLPGRVIASDRYSIVVRRQ